MEKKPEEKKQERKAANAALRGLKSFIFHMIADFALIAGVVLILFGIGEYVSSVLGIPGIGNIALGIVLFLAGFIILSRSKTKVQINMQPQMPPMAPPPPSPPPETGSYR